MTLILASSSPRRSDLLSRLSIPFDVVPSTINERRPRRGEDPSDYAVALAREKATEVASRFSRRPILAADTVVATETAILGKPADTADAGHMLRLLRGTDHVVVTGVAVIVDGELRSDVSVATVTMRRYDDDEIGRYIATGEPMDKAGAYAVQGLGRALVVGVNGCVNTVIGLPLCLVSRLLREAGRPVPPLDIEVCSHTDRPLT